MTLETLQQALQDLPGDGSAPSPPQVSRLAELIDGDQPLQSFLEQLLPQLTEIFSAVAGVVWLRAAQGAIFGVPFQMDQVILTPADQKKHEKLVQLAWQQRQPMLAEPHTNQSAREPSTREQAARDQAGNPTGHRLLFAPVMHLGEPIALVELVLRDTPRLADAAGRKVYLRSLQLVAERIHSGLRKRMSLPAATLQQATEQVQLLTDEIAVHQQQIRRAIEHRLQQFHSWSFGSLTENQRFAKMIHQLLDNHGLRVACTECGHAAILRCLRAGNAKHGVFVFDHYLESGRTFHGGLTTVPTLRVVAKPLRRTPSPVEE
jgi:hypothetical protein